MPFTTTYSRQNSSEANRNYWAFNTNYFFSILAPRNSNWATNCDDACLQSQIDIYGRDYVGSYAGSFSSIGSFVSLGFAESTAERAVVLSMLNEVMSSFFLVQPVAAQWMGTTYSTMVYIGSNLNNPVWQANYGLVLPKVTSQLTTIDPILGQSCLQALNASAQKPDLSQKINMYTNMDDYISDRITDLSWQTAQAYAQFGANIQLSNAEIQAHTAIFYPLWQHAAYNNDYFSVDKAIGASQTQGNYSTVVNAICLCMRIHSLSLENAKLWVKNQCFELEKEYIRRRDEFFNGNPRENCSADLLKWFDAQETLATGFALWNTSSFRYNYPYEQGVKQLFQQRLSQGAVFFDNCTQSQNLMTGGYQANTGNTGYIMPA